MTNSIVAKYIDPEMFSVLHKLEVFRKFGVGGLPHLAELKRTLIDSEVKFSQEFILDCIEEIDAIEL